MLFQFDVLVSLQGAGSFEHNFSVLISRIEAKDDRIFLFFSYTNNESKLNILNICNKLHDRI